MRFAFLLVCLLACGGRLDTPNTSDASTNDIVPCGDAACAASTEFCLGKASDGGYTQTCTPLPPSCHTCDCAKTPSLAMVCVCSSTGDAIDVSCKGL